GWSVAVSLVAPFAAIALSGNPVNAEDDFREVHGQRLFQRLEKLRTRIVGILEKHGVMVLPEMEWRQVVPWLRSDACSMCSSLRACSTRFLTGGPRQDRPRRSLPSQWNRDHRFLGKSSPHVFSQFAALTALPPIPPLLL